MTLFAVMCAGIFPGIHVGRVWMAWFLAPIPNCERHLAELPFAAAVGRVRGLDLLHGLGAVLVHRPGARSRDAARPRASRALRKFLYGFFALGWRGSNRHWRHYEMAYLILAGLSTPLVLSVHSVVSFDFATSILPGWHTTIFPPYFVAGAIFGGFGWCSRSCSRRADLSELKDLITLQHVDKMAKIMLLDRHRSSATPT